MEHEDFDLVASYSQLTNYLSCERKYAYQYRDKWRAPTASRAMTLGTTVHHLLDGWWTGTDVSDLDVDDIASYVIGLQETKTIEECISIAEHALWIMLRYDRMYAKDRGTTTVVAVEQQHMFELPQLGERRYAITTKIDKLIESQQHGGLIFMDHKTTGTSPTSLKQDMVDIDLQFSFYFMQLHADGLDPILALMDSIYTYRWTKKKEVLAWDETPVEDSFLRIPIDRDRRMLEVVAREAYHACERMWHLRQGHHTPLRNISAACGWCEFRSPCFESLQGDDAGETAVLREYFSHPDYPKTQVPVAMNWNEVEIG